MLALTAAAPPAATAGGSAAAARTTGLLPFLVRPSRSGQRTGRPEQAGRGPPTPSAARRWRTARLRWESRKALSDATMASMPAPSRSH